MSENEGPGAMRESDCEKYQYNLWLLPEYGDKYQLQLSTRSCT
jgi:hypothetical protein